MKSSRFKSTLFVLMLTLATGAQTKASLYYLCIGSEHYSIDFEKYAPGFDGLPNLKAASAGAKKMAALLDAFGAIGGRVFLSKPDKFFTQVVLNKELDAILNKIKTEKKPNPLLVVYYSGHGFSAPQLEAHFIPPGDFLQNPNDLNYEKWIEYAISPLDVHEKLQQAGIKHLLLLDCCYEGKQSGEVMPNKYVVKNLGIENVEGFMRQMYNSLKALNRMVGPDPVVFSTKVDSSVTTVPLPQEIETDVGPLCRRVHLIWIKNKTVSLSVKEFTNLLLTKELDSLTTLPVSYVVHDTNNEILIKSR